MFELRLSAARASIDVLHRQVFPQWRELTIHESSPVRRGASERLRREARSYLATQFFPNVSTGEFFNGYRCEDLERLTFENESIDLHVTQDVFEHLPGRFYDIAGFVEQGRWARFTPPFFDQPGPVFELDSVGCCYLVNADLYRHGARHELDHASATFIAENRVWEEDAICQNHGPANSFSDHYSVCLFARKCQLPVRGLRRPDRLSPRSLRMVCASICTSRISPVQR
jgi:hypothetical protein